MSLNPKVGHLYHDGNITSASTVLDAKEMMRTREINAREAKTFDKYSVVIDRAKKVCKRQNDWEQMSIRRHLESINSRTPFLANSLRQQSELMFMNKSRDAWYNLDSPRNNRNGTAPERQGSKDLRKKVNVSSWSVYSHLMTADISRRRPRKTEEKCKTAPPGKYRSWKYQDTCSSAKTENLVKRADQVTRSLHSLYTKSFERKWKEKGTTVLDILNRNSKEELEKALFVLRGTPTGDAIENILRENEHVAKAPSEKGAASDKPLNDTDMLKLSDEVFVTNLGETIIKPTSPDKRSSRASSDRDSIPSPRNKSKQSSHGGSASSGLNVQDLDSATGDLKRPEAKDTPTSHWQDSDNPLTVNEVFERDNSFLLSSMMANASEADSVRANNKWRDIFKAPELWKKGAPVNKEIEKIKPVSIVTLTGKHRQTMLK